MARLVVSTISSVSGLRTVPRENLSGADMSSTIAIFVPTCHNNTAWAIFSGVSPGLR